MVVHIATLPSGRPLYHGTLVQKRLGGKTRRNVVICRPISTEDISAVADLLKKQAEQASGKNQDVIEMGTDSKEESKEKDNMDALGHLAASSVADSPLMILGTGARTYIHFSTVEEVLDERECGAACNLSLATSQKEYRFLASTSTDYTIWIAALRDSFALRNPSTPVVSRSSTLSRSLSQSKGHGDNSRPRRFGFPGRSHTVDSILSAGAPPSLKGEPANDSEHEAENVAPEDTVQLQETVPATGGFKLSKRPSLVGRKRTGVRFAEAPDSGTSHAPVAYPPPIPPKNDCADDGPVNSLSRKISSFLRGGSGTDSREKAPAAMDEVLSPRPPSPERDRGDRPRRSGTIPRLFTKLSSSGDAPEDDGRGRSSSRPHSAHPDTRPRSRSRSLTRLFTLVPSVRMPRSQSLASMFRKHADDAVVHEEIRV
ncbi:hypothetical protein SpCBS45565_g02482 [Spizellomyces sp. 'palustris']|nr:hypothetical protein SpCBS45565_g02482 [Spizellomyces sp. 'palustris']